MERLTDKELLDALNEHEKDCCRCRERICTYESDRYNCLQDKDKKAYKELAEYRRLEEQVLKSTGTDLASMVGEFMHYYNLKKENRLLELPCKVGDAPAVEAKPVVHGEWIFGKSHGEFVEAECSHCKGLLLVKWYDEIDKYRFCPNCGSDMRKKVQE